MTKWFLIALAAASVLLTAAPVEAAQRRTQICAPRNDQFANAWEVKDAELLTVGRLGCASRELGEPKPTFDTARTVWFEYTAAKTGRAVVALTTGFTFGSTAAQVTVYQGSKVTALKTIGTAKLAGTIGGDATSVAFDATAGVTYPIQVSAATSASGSQGQFFVGVRQFGKTGGVALFIDKPFHLLEQDTTTILTVRRVLGASAATGPIRVDANLTGIKPAFALKRPAKAIAPGKPGWYELQDDGAFQFKDYGTVTGLLVVKSVLASTGAALEPTSLTTYATRRDVGATGNPQILVRYDDARRGVSFDRPRTTTARVRNDSLFKAFSCSFDFFGQGWAGSLSAIGISPNNLGERNRPFDLAPGQEKLYDVTLVGQSVAALHCGNFGTTVSSDDLSLISNVEQYGSVADVKISVPAADSYKQIVMRPGKRAITVRLDNTGEYSGDFQIDISDRKFQQIADVTSVCEAGPSGACIGPISTTNSLVVNLAPGETGYLRLNVTRGSEATENGVVRIAASASTRGGTFGSMIGGFEVVGR